jgi:cytoskeleton protein RodZ
MPLDGSNFVESQYAGAAARPRIALDPDMEIGQALKTARQSLGLSLSDVAEATRVRERHLAAIEAGAIDELPARPFTVGYVRAYAKAIGLDADATAARFRTEHPSPDDALRNPAGVKHSKPKRNPLLIAAAIGAVLAVVGWNVSRHVEVGHAAAAIAQRNAVHAPQRIDAGPTGPFTLNAPLPAPPEATAPRPYVTPMVGANAPLDSIATQGAQTPSNEAVAGSSSTFVAQGTIYGQGQGVAGLIIQARKSISLEVRGSGGTVYFARQLAAGEAYRAPALPGLTAEVSNPENAELFENGVSKGAFTAAQMPLRTGG